ncbi:MAG: hypothetical protein OTJ97_10945, partial [SAR202 cluster bacterium]|nr:hypothetical protein [SAR202 cluster bacterium]
MASFRDFGEVSDHFCCNIWREHGAPSGNLKNGVDQLLLRGVLEEVAFGDEFPNRSWLRDGGPRAYLEHHLEP